MQIAVTITYNSGDQVTYVAKPPELAKWEREVKQPITKWGSDVVGLWDLMFIAYHAHKREAGGKPIKSFEAWMETIADVKAGDGDDPKATKQEA
jgi:hypothetical protein